MEGTEVANVRQAIEGAARESGPGRWLIRKLPADVLSRLGEREIEAIASAAGEGWSTHPVDIRISIPWLSRRFYITIVSGPERRPAQRRAVNRRPLVTAGNILFAIGLTSALFLVGAVVTLFLARILVF